MITSAPTPRPRSWPPAVPWKMATRVRASRGSANWWKRKATMRTPRRQLTDSGRSLHEQPASQPASQPAAVSQTGIAEIQSKFNEKIQPTKEHSKHTHKNTHTHTYTQPGEPPCYASWAAAAGSTHPPGGRKKTQRERESPSTSEGQARPLARLFRPQFHNFKWLEAQTSSLGRAPLAPGSVTDQYPQ